MMKHLLTTTAVTLALASAGLAQQAQQQPAAPDQWQQQQEGQAQQPTTGTQAQQGQQQEPTAEAQQQQGEQVEEAVTAQPEGEEQQQEGEAEVIVVTPEGEEQPATGAEQPEGEQTATVGEPAGDPFIVAQEVGQVRVDKVVGMDVVNPQDEDVGQISDLVFDDEGRLVAAVVGVGGFLGLGQKNVAVSWDRIEWTPREDGSIELAMPFTREQLEQAPEFKDLETQRAEEEAAAAEQRALQQQPAGAPGGMAPASPPAQ